ncbi:MAG: T9SS type A sorting domain-containing protein [Saprospiraceae bacterium]|nr:T9SS type A sorting domain-containing protein [Candidatus Defluviibacterium haderslevense]MBK7243595.1 T9SS type A sorting domain-containing protein [Candidatus Defluviibacterium haderslevense]
MKYIILFVVIQTTLNSLVSSQCTFLHRSLDSINNQILLDVHEIDGKIWTINATNSNGAIHVANEIKLRRYDLCFNLENEFNVDGLDDTLQINYKDGSWERNANTILLNTKKSIFLLLSNLKNGIILNSDIDGKLNTIKQLNNDDNSLKPQFQLNDGRMVAIKAEKNDSTTFLWLDYYGNVLKNIKTGISLNQIAYINNKKQLIFYQDNSIVAINIKSNNPDYSYVTCIDTFGSRKWEFTIPIRMNFNSIVKRGDSIFCMGNIYYNLYRSKPFIAIIDNKGNLIDSVSFFTKSSQISDIQYAFIDKAGDIFGIGYYKENNRFDALEQLWVFNISKNLELKWAKKFDIIKSLPELIVGIKELSDNSLIAWGGENVQIGSDLLLNNWLLKINKDSTIIIKTNELPEIESSTFISPNPCNVDIVKINSSFELKWSHCIVIDQLGTIYHTDINNNEINVSNLDSGFYLLQLIGEDNQKIIRKLIRY